MQALDALKQSALQLVQDAHTLEALETARIALLGKKGSISDAMKQLGSVSPEERKSLGATLNAIRTEVEEAFTHKKHTLEATALNERLHTERVDVTLPPRPQTLGTLHPVTQVMEEVIAIFSHMGFQIAEGPDIEDDFHNFTALNIPPSHPARQMHDTFYLHGHEGEAHPVLRTHTSPVQVRAMLKQGAPLRVIAQGSTFRSDSDATHTPMFHQVEGLVIEENITMAHLKGCLVEFLKAFFELDNVPVRFRNSFFPFTEPSAEVDIGCKRGNGEMQIGTGDDWLEILGCGMVHPNVLKACNLDPERYQGFAFGMGIERLAMLKYGMADLRPFFEGDVRWLKHYGFSPLTTPSLTHGL